MRTKEPEFTLNIEWEKRAGIYFGYPKCCIDWFVSRAGFIFNEDGEDDLTENQEAVHNYEGFIPCPTCADKLLDEEGYIKDLIKDRICPTEYSKEHNLMDFLEYMKQYFPEEAQESIDAINNGEYFTIPEWLENGDSNEVVLEDEENFEELVGYIEGTLEREGWKKGDGIFRKEGKFDLLINTFDNTVTLKKI